MEEMWDGTQESFSKRTQELEECVCLWTSYEENMLHVMSSLTKGEMLLADAKSSHESTKDVLENLVDQIEVSIFLRIIPVVQLYQKFVKYLLRISFHRIN